MSEMSRAIRLQIERHGAMTLRDLDDDILDQFVQIVGAWAVDLRAEQTRRLSLAGGNPYHIFSGSPPSLGGSIE